MFAQRLGRAHERMDNRARTSVIYDSPMLLDVTP